MGGGGGGGPGAADYMGIAVSVGSKLPMLKWRGRINSSSRLLR